MTNIWDALARNRAETAGRRISDLMGPDRMARFSAALGDMLLDISKTSIDEAALDLLLQLAQARDVEGRRDAMFAGEKINTTENRAVLHTALRNLSGTPVYVDGQDVMPEVLETLERMEHFATGLRAGTIPASDGQPFTDVLNIGIGGSDLGPVMTTLALAPYHDGPRTHFVSNIDGADIHDTLAGLEPDRTLVIIASKSFTTIETMINAKVAVDWLKGALGDRFGQHLVAVSSATDKTAAFGVPADRVFGFADWVGGRYSIWGPVGLPLMLAVGAENFRQFLLGGQDMDTHFRTAPLAQNLPVLLALTGIWHIDICNYCTRAIQPYDQHLRRLPSYLQQLDMESNGKGVDLEGKPLQRPSGPVVWGAVGSNGQHAFFQLLHQGSQIVPCEFLIAAEGHEPDLKDMHDLLVANCLAQTKALMLGRPAAETPIPQKAFPGNRPSITLAYRKLTPRTLGRIVALYEHRVFVEGVIWNINSFDQFGVELGKVLALDMLPKVTGAADTTAEDDSTRALLAHLQAARD